jgi:hypothetical protein
VDKHYLLPVVAVVETMKESPDMLLLQAHLPSLPGISKDACLAQVILGQGRLASCTITSTKTGAVLRAAQEAYQALERCGDLEWSVHPAPSLHPPAQQQARVSPRNVSGRLSVKAPSLRVSQLSPEILEPLSNPYRRVLLLVDGRRSIEEIAYLLNREPYEIEQMLASLPHLIQ